MGKRGPAVIALALAGAQAGHLLAYEVRFGSSAMQVQSSGAHSYFPALLKTSLGAIALTFTAALLLVAAARLLSRGRGARRALGPPFLGLLATMFTIQLAWFVGQEVTEAVVAGAPVDSASNLLLWGMLGQLPVAVAGAAALRWLWTHVEAAASELQQAVVRAGLPAPTPAPVLIPIVRDSGRALFLAHAAHSPFVKRGPPISSRSRAF